ncbi:MAG TPA: aromatic ring-hydroxylating dioxygenase subunit alpha [Opitutus sp.]|nr:aromatic ring-hydroxylating dioxygenase subunit alpha [Opitutus sp.]
MTAGLLPPRPPDHDKPPMPPPQPPRKNSFPPADWSILARCWHPVARADAVTTAQPFAAQLLDQELVLYRTPSGLTVAADVCAHRGAPLSLGTMCDGAIACAYHGYRYNGEGRCTFIPAHPGAPIPQKLTLRRFAALERFGLIWVCLDDTASPPPAPPEFPAFADDNFQIIHVPPFDWAASAGRQIESFCDVAHFAFVHPVTFAASDPVVPRYDVAPTASGVHADFSSRVGNISNRSAAAESWRRVYDIHLPFTVHLDITFPHGGTMIVFNASCPLSARRTRIFASVARNFDRDQPAADTIAFQQRIYAEDQRIVERQNPEDLPVDLAEEVHVRADRTSVEYRRQLARLGLGRAFTA